jgi:peptide/nickel transport system permease protein
MVALALLAPWLTNDPMAAAPVDRLKAPDLSNFFDPEKRDRFGTDNLGRDIFARTLHGARVSLLVGLSVAALATVIGLAIGLVAGYYRRVDAVVMRVMDGLMSIPPSCSRSRWSR